MKFQPRIRKAVAYRHVECRPSGRQHAAVFRTLLVLLLLFFASSSWSQNLLPQAAPKPSPTPSVASSLELTFEEQQEILGSPQGAMDTFLANMNAEMSGETGRWRVAVYAMNLDDLSGVGFENFGRQKAVELWEVINRLERVDIETIPAEYAGSRYVWRSLRSGQLAFERDAQGRWRFTPATIALTRDFLAELNKSKRVSGLPEIAFADSPYLWFRDHVPGWLLRRTVILNNYQWIGLFLVILLGVIADRLGRVIVRKIGKHQLDVRKLEFDADYLAATAKWSGIFIGGMIWLGGLAILGLPDRLGLVLSIAALFVAVLAGVLAAFRIIDLVAGVFARKAAKTESKIDDLLVPLLRSTAKIFVAAFGIIFIADNLAVNVTSLLAGLGIGGLAFALAAKDTIENLFGSITILIDRPFNIGDWINLNGMDGTVEKIGLRSTRVRTFYNSQITVPNSNLIKATVDNYGRRKYRRFRSTIQVTYNTSPEKIEAFCEGMRELVRRHPYTRKDYFHIYLNDFGAHSLDILLYVFFETPDWATELRERHRLMGDIVRLAHRVGVEFAFPTQTLYLERGTGPAKPDPAPFADCLQVNKQLVEGRRAAREIVNVVQSPNRPGYPPPPVDFRAPIVDEEEHPEEMRRGGDSGG